MNTLKVVVIALSSALFLSACTETPTPTMVIPEPVSDGKL
jgi:uncharacterized lipoprotein YajG